MTQNILRRPEAHTPLLIAAIGMMTVVMLVLQARGILLFSLQSNAVYNPLPSYGPLRQADGSDTNRQRRANTRRSYTVSDESETVWYRAAASSSVLHDLDEARRDRRQRAQYRQWQRAQGY